MKWLNITLTLYATMWYLKIGLFDIEICSL